MNRKYPADKDLENLCSKNKIKYSYKPNVWLITLPDKLSPMLEKKLYAAAEKAQRGGYKVRFKSKRASFCIPIALGICAICKKPKTVLVINVPKELTKAITGKAIYQQVKICHQCLQLMALSTTAKKEVMTRTLPSGWKQQTETIDIAGKPFALTIRYTEGPKKKEKR